MFLIQACFHPHACFRYRKLQSFFSLLEVSEKVFGMTNDTSNSDVKIYPMKYTSIPKQILLVAYAVGFIASCVSILKHFFLMKQAHRPAPWCVLQLWIMQTELPLSREPSESAKVLLTACLDFCNIIKFVF